MTRAAPGGVRRLSVAVLLRDPDKGPKRSQMEINQVTDLVKSAVGFNAGRQDNVTVISRKFADGGDAAATGTPKWYDNAWLPIVARNLTAVVIALLVLILGVRPLAKALMAKRDDAPRAATGQPALAAAGPDGTPQVAGTVGLDQIGQAQGYDERIGAVRGFTRDNPARAALAVRDMIQADRK